MSKSSRNTYLMIFVISTALFSLTVLVLLIVHFTSLLTDTNKASSNNIPISDNTDQSQVTRSTITPNNEEADYKIFSIWVMGIPPVRHYGLSYSYPPGCDIDLHVYTTDGKKHAGLNYETGEFKNEMYSADGNWSGNSMGYEYIEVPYKLPVYTLIDPTPCVEWAKEYGFELVPVDIEWGVTLRSMLGGNQWLTPYLCTINPNVKSIIRDDNNDGVPETLGCRIKEENQKN